VLATTLLTLANNSSANEIYIDQAGDNLVLTVDQKGEWNLVVGKYTDDAPITGDNNNITLNQGYEGNNLIEMSIDGDNNDVTVNQERTANGGYDTDSYGNHYAGVEIDGSGNSVEITQRNNSGSSVGHTSGAVITNGDGNTIHTLQTGTGGSNGHNSYVHVKDGRDGNTVDIFQNSDTADHKAVVSIYSNDNNIDVNQTGGANRAYVLFSTNASGPTDFTLNQNGGDTYGNPDTGSYVTISCGSQAGCTMTVTQ
jgi:hypothetical protein